MSKSVKVEAPPRTCLKSLVRGYLLTHQTEGSSPHTIEYYRGILDRFLWYATKADWEDDARLLNWWHIREFLGYVGTELNRWAREGNGSESSSRKASASLAYAEANAALLPAGLALTALFSQNDMQSAITDYLRSGPGDRHRPFGTVMVRVGPKRLPNDAKAISVSQLARDSNRPELEIVKKLQENGYLLFSEEVFSSLIDTFVADIRRGKLCLLVSRERLAEIAGLNKPESRIRIVPLE